MLIRFCVESLNEVQGRVHLLCTSLADRPFSLLAGARLGGAAVEPWLCQGRATDGSGGQGLCCFTLTDPAARERFAPGQVVELEEGGPQVVPTREGYDRWAAIYDEEDNPLVALEETETTAALLVAAAGRTIADIGCGTGRRALTMAAAGAHVTALDFSDKMLARARAKPGAEQVRFVVCDITRPLPLPPAAFDGVTCCLVLDHIVGLQALLEEMARIARPGGFVLLTVMHPAMMLRGIQAQFTDPGSGAKLRPASAPNRISDYVMAAVRAGFRLEAMSEHEVDAPLTERSPRALRYLGWPLLLVMWLSR